MTPRITRASIIARAKEKKAEIEQYFNAVDYWNTRVRQPHEEPIEPDPDGTMRCLMAYLDGILNGDVYLAPERNP